MIQAIRDTAIEQANLVSWPVIGFQWLHPSLLAEPEVCRQPDSIRKPAWMSVYPAIEQGGVKRILMFHLWRELAEAVWKLRADGSRANLVLDMKEFEEDNASGQSRLVPIENNSLSED